MSVVSTVLLTFSLHEEEIGDTGQYPLVDRINEWLANDNRGTLARLNDHFGGRKAPQAEAWGGAFNLLDEDDFLALVYSLPWRQPHAVVVLINSEHDDGFTVRTPNAGERHRNSI
jgi:hypothetical protein